MRTYLVAILALSAGTVSGALASTVIVVADVEADVFDQEFSVGDIITLPLTIEHESTTGICAVDLELTCASDTIRILSVTINDAFPLILSEEPDEFPAPSYRTVRAQRMTALDHTLAAEGAAVLLGTVELEVLTDAPFDSALTVTAKAATIGRNRPRTVVQLSDTAPVRHGPARITIRHTDPTAEQEPEDEPEPWTEEETTLTFEVQAVGGGDPVTVLAPNTTYELHYNSGYDRLNDYMLFAVAPSADQGLTMATPPASGDWSPPVHFGFYDVQTEQDYLPEWGAEGDLLTDLVYDFWLDTDRYAGPQGHLCNITTGSAGELKLDLFMSWFDLDAYHCAWMRSAAEFTVQEPADEEGGATEDDVP